LLDDGPKQSIEAVRRAYAEIVGYVTGSCISQKDDKAIVQRTCNEMKWTLLHVRFN